MSQKIYLTISKEKMEVGEKNHLTLIIQDKNVADYQSKIKGSNFPVSKFEKNGVLMDRIEDVAEVTSKITEVHKGNEYLIEFDFTLWDSGTYILPLELITFKNQDFSLPSKSVTVYLVPNKPGKDIYDIEEEFETLPGQEKSVLGIIGSWLLSYGWVLIVIAFLILIYWLYRKNSKPKSTLVKTGTSLKESSLKALEALQNEQLWLNNSYKTHYTEQIFILKSYLSARYSVSFLERTTIECIALLKSLDFPQHRLEELKSLLQQADLVKFAKDKTDELTVVKYYHFCREIIIETSPIDIKDV
jgi:hypothetical protein